METDKLSDPKNTRRIIQENDFTFLKKLGQNFLVNDRVIRGIIEAAGITKDDCVVEVGPGIGTLTQYLAEAAGKVVAVEIDKMLLPVLAKTLAAYDNVTVLHQDILKTDLGGIAREYHGGKPLKIVANLPYYITTPILMQILESHIPLTSVTVMVQKEVAERMQAGPGSKEYGALSLAVQYYTKPQIAVMVPPDCFIPKPKVESAVVHLDCAGMPCIHVGNEERMFSLIRASFNQRRKTLVNGLNNSSALPYTRQQILTALEKAGLDSRVRGEMLSLAQFAQLTDLLEEQ